MRGKRSNLWSYQRMKEEEEEEEPLSEYRYISLTSLRSRVVPLTIAAAVQRKKKKKRYHADSITLPNPSFSPFPFVHSLAPL